MSVRHKKHSTLPDGADTSKVRPSDWNDEHVGDDGNPLTVATWLGPFTVNWDDPGILDPGISLAEFQAGTVIYDCLPYFVEEFTGSGFAGFCSLVNGDNSKTLWPLANSNEDDALGSGIVGLRTRDTTSGKAWLIMTAQSIRLVVEGIGAETVEAGQVKIYLLVGVFP